MRQFIRHPTDMPLEYKLENVVVHLRDYLNDISHGGLSFKSCTFLKSGSVIDIRIPIRKPVFEAKGIVIWCCKNEEYKDKCYDVGVEFADTKSENKLRMVEQICYIEHYKKDVLTKEGRKLTGEQAAIEWISKYAKDFPS